MASLDMGEPFDQERLQHKDRKQELHREVELNEVGKHHTEEDLRMVEQAKLHMVVAKHHMEEGLHRVVELPHITMATHSQAPHKEEVKLHMAEEVAVKMVRPYTQVGTMQVI